MYFSVAYTFMETILNPFWNKVGYKWRKLIFHKKELPADDYYQYLAPLISLKSWVYEFFILFDNILKFHFKCGPQSC